MNKCRETFEAQADFETDLNWQDAHNMAGSSGFLSEGGYTETDTAFEYDIWRRGWNNALKEAASLVDEETSRKILALAHISQWDDRQ